MKSFKLLLAGLISTVIAIPASATVIYSVSSTSVVNCSGSPHGLWTAVDLGSPSCANDNYFDIQDGSTFTIFNNDADSANWYAELDATAENAEGLMADIFIRFTGFSETVSNTSPILQYKKEGGLPFNSANDGPALASPGNLDIDFFSSIDFRVSSIDIDGTTYGFNSANDFVNGYGFQFGRGANAKSSSEFGGSAWIQPTGRISHHWDLNLTFTRVPEPSSLLLMGLGFLALGVRKKG